jgi:translocation and assembly module TamA
MSGRVRWATAWLGLALALSVAVLPMPALAQAVRPTLEVDAPDTLRALLERHLDLARAIASQADAQKADAAADTAASVPIGDVEWSRLIAAAPAQARVLVQTEGYFAATAQVQRDGPLVRLSLQPGPPARVERLQFDIQGELGDGIEAGDRAARELRDELLADWPLQAGARFRNADWGDAKSAVLARLRAEGYASATWSGTSAQVDADTQRVRIFVVADSGPMYRAGADDTIDVEGLVHQDLRRVRALAGFGRGTPLTETRLLDYQERLARTGLFDQVTVSLDPDPERAAAAHLRVQLRESSLQAATVAVGISANTGPRATLEYVHRRVAGYAATARNKFEWGRDKQAWDGEISSHPNGRMQRFLVGGAVERLISDSDLVLSQRLRTGRSEDLPGLERLGFVEGEHAQECTYIDNRATDCADLHALSLNLHNTWRRLDNAVLPTSGYTLTLQGGVGIARSPDARRPVDDPGYGQSPFARTYGRATGYWPLGSDWYSQARIELGAVWVRDGLNVPDSLRFRAGGDDSVRGFEWRSLAPTNADGALTGGKLLFTASTELAHPISKALPSVWWATFFDAGRAADSLQALKPAVGYGVGVRWRSPVGPLKLDWAWAPEAHRGRIHLSVGIAF